MNTHPSADSTQTLGVLLQHHSKTLETALHLDAGSARIEVQSLLQAVLQVNRAWLLSHPEQVLDAEQHARYISWLERRLGGEPIAYILGEREFFGLNFKVSPATLIPRPETELLVELALQRIPQALVKQLAIRLGHQETMAKSLVIPPSPTPPDLPLSGDEYGRSMNTFRVLDLGTGSGAIALSIAHARPDAKVVAVDASQVALEVARKNARRLNTGNVRLLHSDWFSALHGEHFDLIVSNPPYVAANDAHLAQGDLRFEPPSALASGADGLDDIRRIITQSKAHLNPGGWLLFEHGHDQAERVRALLQQAGFTGIFSANDLSGIERVSGGACLP